MPKNVKRAKRLSKWIPRLLHRSFIGICLVFLSWVIQNYVYTGWDSSQRRIESHVCFDASTQGLATQYMLLLVTEKRKAEPDAEILFNASANYIIHACNVIKTLEMHIRGEDDPPTQIEQRMVRDSKAAIALKKNRALPELLQRADQLMNEFESLGYGGRERLIAQYQRIRKMKGASRHVFLGLYGAGGLMMAWGYLRKEA